MERTDVANEHVKTLEKLHKAVEQTLNGVIDMPRAGDKASMANALKVLLECRRIEEMMQTRSTIQQVLAKLEQSGENAEAEVLTPEQIAANLDLNFGDIGETKKTDVDVEETETET